MSSEPNNPTDQTLEERVAELEKNVKEIGYVLYDLLQSLRSQETTLALPEPTCPPICPRS
jgi:isochorismate synthase EntC